MRLWQFLSFLLGLTLATSTMAAPKTLGIYVGNNQFPGLGNHDLQGCVNDANQYANAFRLVLGDVEEHRLINAALGTFTAEFQQAVARCRAGEIRRLILTISSHGTTLPGSDGRSASQAIVFSDVNAAMTVGMLEDKTFRALLDQIPSSVGVELLLDTCFSGGATRDLAGRGFRPILRYVPHPGFRPSLHIVKPRAVRSVGTAHMAEWAASSEREPSAEDYLGGQTHGVFTYVWVRNFLLHRGQTRRVLLQAVQTEVTSTYNQHPQLLTE